MIREMAYNHVMEPSYTLDEALEVVGFGKFQALVMAYAGLGTMAESIEFFVLSFIGTLVKDEWELSSGQESLLTTVVFGGMLIGSYLWGFLSDNYGRRVGLLSVGVVTSIFAFLSAFSPNYVSLLVLRMVVGIGVGGGPVYASWYIEFVPIRNRGICMVFFSTFWTMGSILEASLAWIVIPRLGWRWLLALSSVPCLAAFIFYIFTIESPRYLYLNGRISDAQCVLRKMAEVNKTELPSGMLVSDQISGLGEERIHSENIPLLPEIVTKTGFRSLFTLFSSSLLRTTLLIWAVFFANAFVYFGVVLLIPGFTGDVQSKCGMAGLKTNSSLYRNTFISSFAEIPGLILAATLVDKFGRRISLLLLYIFSFIFYLPLFFHQNELIATALLWGIRMCITGNYKLAGIYCPEVYPTSVRTTGYGVASSVGRVAGMICPLVAVDMVLSCHKTAAIGLFEVVIVLGAICALLFPVETKGRKLFDTV